MWIKILTHQVNNWNCVPVYLPHVLPVSLFCFQCYMHLCSSGLILFTQTSTQCNIQILLISFIQVPYVSSAVIQTSLLLSSHDSIKLSFLLFLDMGYEWLLPSHFDLFRRRACWSWSGCDLETCGNCHGQFEPLHCISNNQFPRPLCLSVRMERWPGRFLFLYMHSGCRKTMLTCSVSAMRNSLINQWLFCSIIGTQWWCAHRSRFTTEWSDHGLLWWWISCVEHKFWIGCQENDSTLQTYGQPGRPIREHIFGVELCW